jgi:NAD(P)-dependent dehydrogenase (short-subunit alcohol dehydrogenase family)
MSKAILVTGGAKRIGASMALFLAEQGFDIALHYFSSAKEAKELSKKIHMLGQKCEIFKSDLFDSKNAETLINNAFSLFPKLSVLINSASVLRFGHMSES